MDALVLRRCFVGSVSPQMKAAVSGRPNLLAGEDFPPEPRQKRSLDKRTRLMQAGLTLFGEKGYQGASIEEIARRAQLAVGGFYQHFRSKRQLLLSLMDDLLEKLSGIDLSRKFTTETRAGLHDLLSRAFSQDLHYLGAYRAWQEATLVDPELGYKQLAIQAWTTGRVTRVFQFLEQLPGARPGVDVVGLARAMDTFFWSLLAQAARLPRAELDRWIESSVHLIYHAMFLDAEKSA